VEQLATILSSDEGGGPVRMVLDGPSNGKELFGFCTELMACCLVRMFGDERGEVSLTRLSTTELDRAKNAIRRTGIILTVSDTIPVNSVNIGDADESTPLDRIRLSVPISKEHAIFIGFSFDRTLT
jgi:hypothetical protein